MSSELAGTKPEAPAVCRAKTKSGRPCPALAEPGSDYCALHQPAGGEERARSETFAQQGAREEERQRLVAEIERLLEQLRALSPGEGLPTEAPRRLAAQAQERLAPLRERLGSLAPEPLRGLFQGDLTDPEFWKGSAYMLKYLAGYQADLVKRRYTGEYETDEWGLDSEAVDALRPVFSLLHKMYWRVKVAGIEHVPVEGPALLVANHCAPLPWDGLILQMAVLNEHTAGRLVRPLYEEAIPRLPAVSSLLTKLGHALALPENGARLLAQGELVVVFPEGVGGAGRGRRERRHVAPFEEAGLVAMAVRAGVPIVPTALQAGVTRWRMHTAWQGWARSLTEAPPALEAWQALGPLPPPTPWSILFGEPIRAADDGRWTMDDGGRQMADLLRYRLQEMLT